MTKEELLKIIARHKSWINGSDGGCRADLSGANLIGADLIGANLSGANLSRASLRGAVGGNSRIQSLQISPYKIIILGNHIVWGGCTKKTAGEWLEYDGEKLSPTDKIYLETVTKQFIRMVCR